MQVVDSGYKIDLHIHSVFSRGKDKSKVAYNTLDKISVLADKLNGNGVQMCAITDHDVFSYEMYSELKNYEAKDNYSIIKVFPGVEFSVKFHGDDGDSIVHVIAIFNDENKDKVQKIASCIENVKKNSEYCKNQSISEEEFLEILREIELDTVLIAHQKSTLSTIQPHKNDAITVGDERFKEFIYTDYFEAFEFKNRKNEVFNKSYLKKNNMKENIRFITGSDCHDWRYYPKETEKDKTDFIYSYIKCIPNFRGLVMAITDHRRIKTVNSFFNPTQVYTKFIKMSINGLEYQIPLSKGINVIIGDNSIGKSLLLHKLTGYMKHSQGKLNKNVVEGYKKYLKNNGILIDTEIPESEVFMFDMQGEIREKFEQEKLKSDAFLKKFYPLPIETEAYKEKIQRKLKQIYYYLREKYEIEDMEDRLSKFNILDENIEQAESLTFLGTVSKDTDRVDGYEKVRTGLNSVVEKIQTVAKYQWIHEEDIKILKGIIEQLSSMATRYLNNKMLVENENTRIALYMAAVNEFKQEYQECVSDSHKKLAVYNEDVDSAADSIAELLLRRRNNKIPDFEIETETIDIRTERVYEYEFNSRVGITEISTDYIKNLFDSLLRKKYKGSILKLTKKELAEAISGYTNGPEEALNVLIDSIDEQINEDFKEKFTITQAGTDRTQELSSGFNSKIYFDLLSYETRYPGIYIIDQPEDNVSQKSINEYLLDRFKTMGENRQVIIVTHNPQFIVNLDVDNVIYLGKENGEFVVRSGALEYKDDDCNILEIISDHIEGGLETLRRRWKRYEKNY